MGHAQAADLAARLDREAITYVYSSPLERCTETAAAVATQLGVPLRSAPEAVEIDFGDWTGQDFAELEGRTDWSEWNSSRDTAGTPGGESMVEVQQRILELLEALRQRHCGERIALVSHGDVIKAALCHTLGLPLQAYTRFNIDPASLSPLVLWQGGGKVLGMNELPAATHGTAEH
jgi:probable phosphoglycerate mutase